MPPLRDGQPPPTTFHLVPRDEWDATDPATAYTPTGFERDRFVHCTDGPAEVAATANRYFADLAGDLLVLVLDRARLSAPVRYEDEHQVYPHVYGPIERAAIVNVIVMPRAADGTFAAPVR
ncbi:MAG TPA: DUF952 domain-containing protein [Chloroflexota bacterium]|nr:DUF952 domain-containing protein [Chloroflexota bacterium]